MRVLRSRLYEKMQQLMATDKAKHTILPLTKYGLMQITRQRVRPEAISEAKEVCPTCGGSGKISPSILYDKQIENQIAYYTEEKGIRWVKIVASPMIAAYLRRGFWSIRTKWQFKYGCRIKIREDQSLGMLETKILDKKGRTLM